MTNVTRLEKQARLYWRTMQEGIARNSLSDYQDELETLALVTDSPVLRENCRRGVHRFDHIGTTVKLAYIR